MVIELPTEVRRIIDRLLGLGYEAYAVGGAVRDAVIGRTPTDWDITTNATPLEVKSAFKRTVDTGLKHGTVTVLMGRNSYEVTTYRIDGEYTDLRHPKDVTFTSSLTEDLKRRDFTINAMAYNDADGLVDIFGGVADLRAGVIRTVGDPGDRFTEDALRMLRALRFAAQLGFEVDKGTLDAIRRRSGTIVAISSERIREELLKLIQSDNPSTIIELYNLGLTNYILPEFDKMMECEQNSKHHMYNVGVHTAVAMEHIKPTRILRLAMLLHDCGKPDCKSVGEDGYDHFYNHQEVGAEIATKVLRRLKFDNDTIKKVVRLVRYHDERPELTDRAVRKKIAQIGEVAFPDIFLVNRADTMAKSEYMREEKLAYIDEFERIYDKIISAGQCLKVTDLAINGKALIDMGVNSGPLIGQILHQLLDEVIEEPSRNESSYLEKRAKELIEEHVDG